MSFGSQPSTSGSALYLTQTMVPSSKFTFASSGFSSSFTPADEMEATRRRRQDDATTMTEDRLEGICSNAVSEDDAHHRPRRGRVISPDNCPHNLVMAAAVATMTKTTAVAPTTTTITTSYPNLIHRPKPIRIQPSLFSSIALDDQSTILPQARPVPFLPIMNPDADEYDHENSYAVPKQPQHRMSPPPVTAQLPTASSLKEIPPTFDHHPVERFYHEAYEEGCTGVQIHTAVKDVHDWSHKWMITPLHNTTTSTLHHVDNPINRPHQLRQYHEEERWYGAKNPSPDEYNVQNSSTLRRCLRYNTRLNHLDSNQPESILLHNHERQVTASLRCSLHASRSFTTRIDHEDHPEKQIIDVGSSDKHHPEAHQYHQLESLRKRPFPLKLTPTANTLVNMEDDTGKAAYQPTKLSCPFRDRTIASTQCTSEMIRPVPVRVAVRYQPDVNTQATWQSTARLLVPSDADNEYELNEQNRHTHVHHSRPSRYQFSCNNDNVGHDNNSHQRQRPWMISSQNSISPSPLTLSPVTLARVWDDEHQENEDDISLHGRVTILEKVRDQNIPNLIETDEEDNDSSLELPSLPRLFSGSKAQKARDGILYDLAVSGGDPDTPFFTECLKVLQEHYQSQTYNNNTCMASQSHVTRGTWVTLTKALYFGNLGEKLNTTRTSNIPVLDPLYTLGRMSFDMFAPTRLVCSLQGTFNQIEAVCGGEKTPESQGFRAESLPSSIPSCTPQAIREEAEKCGGVLQTYDIIAAFTIEPPQPDDPTAPNQDVRRPIRGLMTTHGYTLADPDRPNRHSIWITGGEIKPNADPQDVLEWKRLFALHPPKHTLGEKAKLLALQWLMGATVPNQMSDDGKMEYSFSKPLGGHGKAFIDTLFVDETLRIVRGHRGTTFVFSRIASQDL